MCLRSLALSTANQALPLVVSRSTMSATCHHLSSSKNLKILFFPFMAQGHILPMVDMAKLFSSRGGVDAIILTTPANAPLITPYIDRAANVRLHVIPFPSCPGLPEGCENASAFASPDPEVRSNFFRALSMMRQPFDSALAELAPDCAVTDMFLPWTVDVAEGHGIPRLVFHGTNFFSQCVFHSLEAHKPLDHLPAGAESFLVPGLPHEIRILASQMDRSRGSDPVRAELFAKMRESEEKSYGAVVNSFYELEPDYVRHYRDVMGRKAWHVGPVSLLNERDSDASVTGWLDGRGPDSVVYVCFGSMADFSRDHIREMAAGLEASGHPFVWVVRTKGGGDVLPEGFEERTEGRGLVIKGWAPQTSILSHEAVGCFVTHCGWNSSLEAISAGVPMVTWPLFAEQFFNERLIVDVLRIGVAVGVKVYSRWVEDRDVIGAERMEMAVNEVMGNGEEAEGRRRRAKELGEKARRAVEEGGSSYVDVGNLIQELIDGRREFNGVQH